MAFIRIKKIKGKEYGYLVQNKWRKGKNKGVKQKVKSYLGRVYRLCRVEEKDFWETVDSDAEIYLKIATKEKILHDLVRFEMIKHGFVNIKGKWVKEGVVVDIDRKKIVNESSSGCVLAINEGYLCSYRLKRLFNYEANGEIEEVGPELARLFIESGIDIPQDVFIGYYEKI